MRIYIMPSPNGQMCLIDGTYHVNKNKTHQTFKSLTLFKMKQKNLEHLCPGEVHAKHYNGNATWFLDISPPILNGFIILANQK